MQIEFTKMQGAGNDFVVLDETRAALGLSRAQLQWLAHRQLGVGADQILVVGPSPAPGIDFSYRIFNADGGEVQHCGNGARCFVRYVRERGLTTKRSVKVRTVNTDLVLTEREDGLVTVDMGTPKFAPESLPFDPEGLASTRVCGAHWYALPLVGSPTVSSAFFSGFSRSVEKISGSNAIFNVAIASMGNPHVVVQVADVNAPRLAEFGSWLREHPRFAQGVNAGFMQVLSSTEVRLRVVERGVGETLACGTGACAAVACGIQSGILSSSEAVTVHARGGDLLIQWPGSKSTQPLMMSGPAVSVFSARVEVPTNPFLP